VLGQKSASPEADGCACFLKDMMQSSCANVNVSGQSVERKNLVEYTKCDCPEKFAWGKAC
jgi:hypothetical protein